MEQTILHSVWRPVGGWICMCALAYELILLPLISSLLVIVGHPATLIHVEQTLLLEMIALFVGYRTFEKYHEVATK